MRFAARESAIFGQPEPGFGVIPGAGGVQHLARLMGRARALEVMLSAQDYDAELAERYGWINRALARRRSSTISSDRSPIGSPGSRPPAVVTVKDRVNAIALAPVEDFRRDSDLFGEGVRNPEAQSAIPSRVEARLPDPRRGNGPGRVTGRLGRRLIERRTCHVS